MEFKTTEAQRKASKMQRKKNPEKTHNVLKRSSKNFIKNYADNNELLELKGLIEDSFEN